MTVAAIIVTRTGADMPSWDDIKAQRKLFDTKNRTANKVSNKSE